MKKVSGIYVITNTFNSKVYVGAAKSIGTRWANHRKDLNQGKHHSEYLQRAWNKYGKDAFVFEVLEVLENYYQDAPSREIYWMEKLKACDRSHGYNIIAVARMTEVVAELNRNRIWKDESRKKLIEANTGRKQSGRVAAGENHFKARPYSLLSPDDKTVHIGKNLSKFAAEQGICARGLFYVVCGKLCSYKGWTNYEKPKSKEHRYAHFRVQSPDGTVYEGRNLSQFAREHGLSGNLLSKLVKGKFQSYKGWTCPDFTFKPNTQRWRRFKIKSPDGVIHNACSLRGFAREHGLDVAALGRVLSGKNKSHRGWTKV